MPTYEIDFILNLFQNMTSNKLNSDVDNYLNNILLDIKKPVYNISPNFNSFYKNNKQKNVRNYKNSKKTYNKPDNDIKNDIKNDITNDITNDIINDKLKFDREAGNNYRINRIKDINNKSEYDMIITNIRKILNKITEQTYDKLKNEFLCYYKSIQADKNNISKINLHQINIYIFESLVYNNIIFNNLYSDLLDNLININSDFSVILNNNLEIFYNIHKLIQIPTSCNSYNELTDINKHNDKYKCLCRFYIYCLKINLIPHNTINDLTIKLQEELISNIKIENKKDYNELLTQFIFLITSNIEFTDETLIAKFRYIANLNININKYPSISNKIIFKHKDILEKNINY